MLNRYMRFYDTSKPLQKANSTAADDNLRFTITTLSIEIYDAQRGKKALMPYAKSKGQDERAHTCSLVWAFFVGHHILQFHLIL